MVKRLTTALAAKKMTENEKGVDHVSAVGPENVADHQNAVDQGNAADLGKEVGLENIILVLEVGTEEIGGGHGIGGAVLKKEGEDLDLGRSVQKVHLQPPHQW